MSDISAGDASNAVAEPASASNESQAVNQSTDTQQDDLAPQTDSINGVNIDSSNNEMGGPLRAQPSFDSDIGTNTDRLLSGGQSGDASPARFGDTGISAARTNSGDGSLRANVSGTDLSTNGVEADASDSRNQLSDPLREDLKESSPIKLRSDGKSWYHERSSIKLPGARKPVDKHTKPQTDSTHPSSSETSDSPLRAKIRKAIDAYNVNQKADSTTNEKSGVRPDRQNRTQINQSSDGETTAERHSSNRADENRSAEKSNQSPRKRHTAASDGELRLPGGEKRDHERQAADSTKERKPEHIIESSQSEDRRSVHQQIPIDWSLLKSGENVQQMLSVRFLQCTFRDRGIVLSDYAALDVLERMKRLGTPWGTEQPPDDLRDLVEQRLRARQTTLSYSSDRESIHLAINTHSQLTQEARKKWKSIFGPLDVARSVGEFAEGFGEMFWDDLKEGRVRDQIFAAVKGMGEAVTSLAKGVVHLGETLLKEGPVGLQREMSDIPVHIVEAFFRLPEMWESFCKAEPEEQSRMIGRLTGEVELFIVTREVGRVPTSIPPGAPAVATEVVVTASGEAALRTGVPTLSLEALGPKAAQAGQYFTHASQISQTSKEAASVDGGTQRPGTDRPVGSSPNSATNRSPESPKPQPTNSSLEAQGGRTPEAGTQPNGVTNDASAGRRQPFVDDSNFKREVLGEFAEQQRKADRATLKEELAGSERQTVATQSNPPGSRSESSSARAGNFIHKDPQTAHEVIREWVSKYPDARNLKADIGLKWPEGVTPNVGPDRYVMRLRDGKTYIPDGIDWNRGIIYELKPKSQVALGIKTARKYAMWMDQEAPLASGSQWAHQVVTYDEKVLMRILRKMGYLER